MALKKFSEVAKDGCCPKCGYAVMKRGVNAVTGNLAQALQLYRDETALEPENGNTWVDLGTFYYDNGAWAQAYDALSRAWRHDPQRPTGTPCGIPDQARHKALGTWPPSCPRGS